MIEDDSDWTKIINTHSDPITPVISNQKLARGAWKLTCNNCYVRFYALYKRKKCIECQNPDQRRFRAKMIKEKGPLFFINESNG